MDKNTASKTKIVSIVISLGIIATLIIGVISVVRSVNSNRNNENNIVNLNETQENVAIKTEDVTDDILGNIDDELQEANAGASMAVDTDNISNKADNTYNTHKAGTDDADKETEPTVPPTLSSEEVMAEAMKNFAFDMRVTSLRGQCLARLYLTIIWTRPFSLRVLECTNVIRQLLYNPR